MKKTLLIAFALAFAASSGTSFAQYAGFYGFGIELDGSGSATNPNNGKITLYALDNNSDLTLSSPMQVFDTTDWTGSSTGVTPTFSLGTFTQGVSSLTLTGGAMDTYKGGGADVTGTSLFYSVGSVNGANSATFTGVNLPFGVDDLPSSPYGSDNQLWDTQSSSINLLSGLTPGTYELAVYGAAYNTVSNAYANNGGTGINYGATFTVVAAPEPSTWALMFGGLGLLVCFQRLRRKSAV